MMRIIKRMSHAIVSKDATSGDNSPISLTGHSASESKEEATTSPLNIIPYVVSESAVLALPASQGGNAAPPSHADPAAPMLDVRSLGIAPRPKRATTDALMHPEGGVRSRNLQEGSAPTPARFSRSISFTDSSQQRGRTVQRSRAASSKEGIGEERSQREETPDVPSGRPGSPAKRRLAAGSRRQTDVVRASTHTLAVHTPLQVIPEAAPDQGLNERPESARYSALLNYLIPACLAERIKCGSLLSLYHPPRLVYS